MAESIRLVNWRIVGGKGLADFNDGLGLEVNGFDDLKSHVRDARVSVDEMRWLLLGDFVRRKPGGVFLPASDPRTLTFDGTIQNMLRITL